MVLWGVIWGGILGLFSGDFGFIVGALLGAVAGQTLRSAIHTEIQIKLRQALHSQTETRSALNNPTHQAAATVATPVETAKPVDLSVTPPVQALQPASEALTANNTANTIAESNTLTKHAIPIKSVQTRESLKPNLADSIERAISSAMAWFTGGNSIVRIGLVILFIGLSFLARYAANIGLFPVELRLSALGLVALAMLAIGFRKRTIKPEFALSLQGAGVAVLYLTIFAAFRLYDLLPSSMAFFMLVVVCAFGCALALLQNSRALAAAAFIGGFAAPILLSTGQGSHIALFSYYALLNLGIVWIAYQRSWRALNLIGFIATFGVAAVWGVLKFESIHYTSAQAFLILFVVIFISTALLYARNTPTKLGNAVDSTLVFGTPLIGFGLQAGLLRTMQAVWSLPFNPLAYAAMGFSAVYLLLSLVLRSGKNDSNRLITECFTAIGVVFATVAIPLALDAHWTAATWALEGLGAFWVGMRQARWIPRAFGLLLQPMALMAFVLSSNFTIYSDWWFFNPVFMGAILLAIPAFILSWWLRNALPHSGTRLANAYTKIETPFSTYLFIYAFIAWCGSFLLEILYNSSLQLYLDKVSLRAACVMLWILCSSWLSLRFGIKKQWSIATKPRLFSLPVMVLTYVFVKLADQTDYPLASVFEFPAYFLWGFAIVLHYSMLYISERIAGDKDNTPTKSSFTDLSSLHAVSVWFACILLADGLWLVTERAGLWNTSWGSVISLFTLTATLIFLSLWAGNAKPKTRWPLRDFSASYYWTAAQPLAVLLMLAIALLATLSRGNTEPLPYLPLLNPTDLSLLLALLSLLLWRKCLLQKQLSNWVTERYYLLLISALGFLILNTVWLRTASHFFHVPWTAEDLFASFVVQTGYAILWSVTALVLMVLGSKRQQRTLWLVGAGLLAMVVVKLFLIDLSNTGGSERIITFIVVGLLMLVVGYFSPIPPAPDNSVSQKPTA